MRESPSTHKPGRSSPPLKHFLLASVTLIVSGWGGLYAVLNYTQPSGGTRWMRSSKPCKPGRRQR